MKRIHLHVSVPDLAQSIQFYETLFGASPSVVKDDYAKWILEEPRVNFAISQRGVRSGVDHIGIQVENPDELEELSLRLKTAGAQTFDEEGTTCCYARSDKSWVTDPAGVHWETFYTFGEAVTYGEDPAEAAMIASAETGACCGGAPKVAAAPCC